MASSCPEDLKKLAYMCHEKQNNHKDSLLSYLEDILELPDLPDDDQEVWSHLLLASIWPEYSKNVAYMCHQKENTYQDSSHLYPTWWTSLEDILDLPNLPDDDHDGNIYIHVLTHNV